MRPPPFFTQVLNALADDRRIRILDLLKDPMSHFPAQLDSDLVADGVCDVLIARKAGLSLASGSAQLRILSRAHFIEGKRIKHSLFYRRDEASIQVIRDMILSKF